MKRTISSIILCALERRMRIKGRSTQTDLDKYTPEGFLHCVSDRAQNPVLETMCHQAFDTDLFNIAINLFRWYDSDSKLLLLKFFRTLIEEPDFSEPESFRDKRFLDILKFMRKKGTLEFYYLSIVEWAMRSDHIEEVEVVKAGEELAVALISAFFYTVLGELEDEHLKERDLNYLNMIKKLIIVLLRYQNALMLVLDEALMNIQEVVNAVWT